MLRACLRVHIGDVAPLRRGPTCVRSDVRGQRDRQDRHSDRTKGAMSVNMPLPRNGSENIRRLAHQPKLCGGMTERTTLRASDTKGCDVEP